VLDTPGEHEGMKTIKETIFRFKTAMVLSAALFSSVTASAQTGPKIEASEVQYSFGSVYQGTVVKHVFTLRNSGKDTLQIENVRSSCGCTVAMADKKAVAPGESTRIEANFNSDRFSGHVNKDIYVQSNDPVQPVTKLSITGEVKVDLSISPSTIYFSGLKEGAQALRKLAITNNSENTITIREISSTVPDLRFELPKLKLQPGERTELSLIVDKVTRDTRLTGNLTIHISGPQKEVNVRLFGGAID
jgi:hypothetical protein